MTKKTSKVSAALQAKLKKAREKFAKAKPAETNDVANRKVPDGIYTAKLCGCEFDEFGKKPIVRFVYEITDADKKALEVAIGEIVENRFNLDNDEGPSFVKRDLGRFGYDECDDLLDDPNASMEMFEELVSFNPICKIMVAMDDTDQWQNVYLNSVIEMDESDEEETDEKGTDEDPADDGKEGEEEATTEGEAEEVAEDDDELELEVGDIVQTTYKDKDVTGTVTAIDEENDTVKVKMNKPKRIITVSSDDVFVLEG